MSGLSGACGCSKSLVCLTIVNFCSVADAVESQIE